eukprot:TRINITY_DN702_c3_g1_i1.p1 TRINITY_DN702_c3_g1~~TRINITY_DN702_c3_g1_i1.p1  ORF type:complete len:482 (+),score=155.81 TRINITY_DN702_c3_g1_i1:37-1482(+)
MTGANISGRVRVVARVRPLASTEPAGSEFITAEPSAPDTTLRVEAHDGCVRGYHYDHVLDAGASQEETYEAAAADIVESVLEGYNGAVIAYGQTGSGKTYSMLGGREGTPEMGVIPRIARDLFSKQRLNGWSASVSLSFFQLYQERIYCMIEPYGPDGKARDCKLTSEGVSGVVETYVDSPSEMVAVIRKAEHNRKVATTKMNMVSSRSHACCIVNVVRSGPGWDTASQLYLVDLAGSESVDKTGSEGVSLEEAKKINLSLLALRRCVTALHAHEAYVPYRDSALTNLLRGALGGNSRTCMLICVSPSRFNERESIATLYFGLHTNSVATVAVKTVWKSTEQLEEELASLHQRIEAAVQVERLLNKKMKGLEAQGDDGISTLHLPPPPIPTPDSLAARVPNDWLCPLTEAPYTDPVILSDGRTYERAAAEAYLERHGVPPCGVAEGVKIEHLLVVVPDMNQRALMKRFYLNESKDRLRCWG